MSSPIIAALVNFDQNFLELSAAALWDFITKEIPWIHPIGPFRSENLKETYVFIRTLVHWFFHQDCLHLRAIYF